MTHINFKNVQKHSRGNDASEKNFYTSFVNIGHIKKIVKNEMEMVANKLSRSFRCLVRKKVFWMKI